MLKCLCLLLVLSSSMAASYYEKYLLSPYHLYSRQFNKNSFLIFIQIGTKMINIQKIVYQKFDVINLMSHHLKLKTNNCDNNNNILISFFHLIYWMTKAKIISLTVFYVSLIFIQIISFNGNKRHFRWFEIYFFFIFQVIQVWRQLKICEFPSSKWSDISNISCIKHSDSH